MFIPYFASQKIPNYFHEENWENKKFQYFSETKQIRVDANNVPLISLVDRKSTRLNSSHSGESRMPSSA